MPRHLREPRLRRRWLLAFVCLLFTGAPLVGTLGYESSLLLAPIVACLAVGVGVDAVRAERASKRSVGPEHHGGTVSCVNESGECMTRLLTAVLMDLLVLLGIACGVLFVGQIWQPSCDPWGGLWFFLMGPGMSGVVGTTCGLWGAVLMHPRRARRTQVAVGLLPFALCLLLGLWRLYAEPVVFAYDPFWGYFSGSIYDEAITLGRTYLLFRAYNLAGVAAAVLLLHLGLDATRVQVVTPSWNGPTRLEALVVSTLALATAAMGWNADRLGFTATQASLARALSGTHVTDHFVIHYVPASSTAREIELVASEHEFAWHRLHELMGREPRAPVHSYVFASSEQKRTLMGAGNVEVAAPWRGQIYLNHQAFPHSVLHHELAHVFASTVGDPVFGVSASTSGAGAWLNLALVEGIATALAPQAIDRLDVHDQAAVLDRLGLMPKLSDIMGAGFWAKASRHAYTSAGSFCLWLIETYGFEPMAVLYRSAGDFVAAYERPLSELEDAWLAFLRARNVSEDDVRAQSQRYKVKAIFERPCAHRAANLAREAQRASIKGEHALALAALRDLCTIEPERPEHRVALAHGLVWSGDHLAAIDVLTRALELDDLTEPMRATLEERRGDVHLLEGRHEQAALDYASAMARSNAEERRRVLRLKALAAADPYLAPLIVDYLAPFDPDPDHAFRFVARLFAAVRIARLVDYEAIGRYLTGRQLLNAQQAGPAVLELDHSLELQHSVPPEFVRAARLALLDALVRLHHYNRARELLAALQASEPMSSGLRLALSQWRARIDYMSGRLTSRE